MEGSHDSPYAYAYADVYVYVYVLCLRLSPSFPSTPDPSRLA